MTTSPWRFLRKAFQAHSRAVGIQEEITVCYVFLPVSSIYVLESRWTAVAGKDSLVVEVYPVLLTCTDDVTTLT
jgi:hypothetical protein